MVPRNSDAEDISNFTLFKFSCFARLFAFSIDSLWKSNPINSEFGKAKIKFEEALKLNPNDSYLIQRLTLKQELVQDLLLMKKLVKRNIHGSFYQI